MCFKISYPLNPIEKDVKGSFADAEVLKPNPGYGRSVVAQGVDYLTSDRMRLSQIKLMQKVGKLFQALGVQSSWIKDLKTTQTIWGIFSLPGTVKRWEQSIRHLVTETNPKHVPRRVVKAVQNTSNGFVALSSGVEYFAPKLLRPSSVGSMALITADLCGLQMTVEDGWRAYLAEKGETQVKELRQNFRETKNLRMIQLVKCVLGLLTAFIGAVLFSIYGGSVALSLALASASLLGALLSLYAYFYEESCKYKPVNFHPISS